MDQRLQTETVQEKANEPLKKHDRAKSFDQILLEAIDEALLSLGESVKISTYFYVEALFKVTKQEIPVRLNDFSNALEQIFGLGARHLEILIMKSLHSRIRNVCEQISKEWAVPGITFQEYVNLAKQKFEESSFSKIKIEAEIYANEVQEHYV
jgi:hypothetical protein